LRKFWIADCALRLWDEAVIRGILSVIEIAILSGLILATRCANYQDVFVAGNVYFVDADCYARMTRAQMVRTEPGLIIRHHAFENFPQGTTPHTTAPLDYLIVSLSILLKPFTAQPIDFAGAVVSPFLGLLGGGILGALLFYLITNTASWLMNPFNNPDYPKTLLGWIKALTIGTTGWPQTWEFFRNTLMSGGLFTALFVATAKLTAPAESPADKEAGVRESEGEAEPQAEPEEAKA